MYGGSLFSGIGGIEIGFEQAGFKTIWFVEKDRYCQAILRKRFPSTTIYDDITKIDFRKVPGIDFLTGGFPCQDISNAGKRAGIKGSRSSLWRYYLEAIRILRPRFVFIENVSALINRGLDVVLADIAKIRYDAEWHCIPASAIGAPHQRDRIFIIAYPDSGGLFYRQTKEFAAERGEQAQLGTVPSCQDVSNTESNGLYGGILLNGENSYRIQRVSEKKQSVVRSKTSKCSKIRGTTTNWAVEPKSGRVANGIPNRVDRIRCLGNAVVPQIAEVFAKAIKEVINNGIHES